MAIVNEMLGTLLTHASRQSETLAVLRQAVERAAVEQRRADEADKRSRDMRSDEEKRSLQSRYDPIFDAYGQAAPRPVSDQEPMDYKFRLLKAIRGKLSRADDRSVDGGPTKVGDLAGLKLGGLNDATLNALEPQFLAAATLQAAQPHPSVCRRPALCSAM